MNWYIGQEIVAIRNHSQGRFKMGNEFIVKGLRSAHCNCARVLIDVGFVGVGTHMKCGYCGSRLRKSDNIHWKQETCFAPLDQDISELTEVLTKKQPFEL